MLIWTSNSEEKSTICFEEFRARSNVVGLSQIWDFGTIRSIVELFPDQKHRFMLHLSCADVMNIV